MRRQQTTLEKELIKPIVHRFQRKDVIQVLIGASILGIPIGFTEEVWKLGESLALANILGILLLSLIFITSFVYYQYHHKNPRKSVLRKDFYIRIVSTYIGSLIVVALILTLIGQAPWTTDWITAIKRSILVTFPASMTAVIADSFK